MELMEDRYSVPWELLGEGGRRMNSQMRVTDPWYLLRMERTLDLIASPKGHAIDVLDLGCGVGLYDFSLGRRWSTARITGVDVNREQVEFANDMAHKLALSDRLQFVRADVATFTAREAYDVVLLTDIVEHLEDPSGCLATARMAVRTGGQVIVSVPVTSRPKQQWWFYRQMLENGTFAMGDAPEELDPARPILRYWHKDYTPKELATLLQGNGFDVTQCVVCRFDYPYVRKRCPSRLRRLLDFLFSDRKRALKPRLDRIACAVMPRWAKTGILVATKR